MSNGEVINSDCIEVMKSMKDERFHSVVTDPPYNFEDGFMQQEWDNIGNSLDYQEWCEKWAKECFRVLKPGGHMIAFSGERQHHRLMVALENVGFEMRHTIPWIYGSGMPKGQRIERWLDEEYKEEFGDWRSLLKPSIEFAILVRKPVKESASKNQMEYGTGNLNVEACRIEGTKPKRNISKEGNANSVNYQKDIQETSGMADGTSEEGRYPANLILDSTMAEVVDGMSPVSDIDGEDVGASRFFYCTKASKSERTHDGEVENDHNTVKPLDLMIWLMKLVTAEGQSILDPFAGSGTTLVAAEKTDRKYVGIEKEKEYVEIIKNRLEKCQNINYEEDETVNSKDKTIFDY